MGGRAGGGLAGTETSRSPYIGGRGGRGMRGAGAPGARGAGACGAALKGERGLAMGRSRGERRVMGEGVARWGAISGRARFWAVVGLKGRMRLSASRIASSRRRQAMAVSLRVALRSRARLS